MVPTFNAELAWAAYEQAKKNEAHWFQGSWRAFFVKPLEVADGIYRCGTTYCFAGWVAEIDHGQWLLGNKLLAELAEKTDSSCPENSNLLVARGDENGSHPIIEGEFAGTRVIDAEERAINALGITGHEAWFLFSGDRTLDEIEWGLKQIERRRANDMEAGF